MALKVTQEYIARDANNIARVEDYGNIVSIKGNIFLYPPKKSHSILLSFILGFVGPMSSNYLTIVSDCQLPFFFCLQTARTECAHAQIDHRRVIFRPQNIARGIMFLNMCRFTSITLLPSLSQSAWNTRLYFGH